MIYKEWIKNKSAKRLAVVHTFEDSHWESFERIRRAHNDIIFEETNKLVLRLDKLVNPENETEQRAHLDKSLVEWTSDKLVKLCPYCAKPFTLTWRRHHCRVCGAVQCGDCSLFLRFRDACRLVRPAKIYTDPYDQIEERIETKKFENMPKVRLCEDCKRALDRRLQMIEDRYSQTVSSLYEKLRNCMAEADELMLSSGNCEESRGKVQELKQRVLSTAKKLLEGHESLGNKQAYLMKEISRSASYWLNESMNKKLARLQKFAPPTPECARSGTSSEAMTSAQG